MTPTDDNYANRTTSTQEYEPRTFCVAVMKILGGGCRAMDSENAAKWSSPNHGLQSIVANVLSLLALQGCPRHCYNSGLTNQRAVLLCMLEYVGAYSYPLVHTTAKTMAKVTSRFSVHTSCFTPWPSPWAYRVMNVAVAMAATVTVTAVEGVILFVCEQRSTSQ